jgi:hypothetical protein
MQLTRFARFVAAAGLVTLPVAASAAPILPTSYDMLNGNTGSYNYWDESYDGLGLTAVDNAPLTGGLGDLTDGVIAPDNWNVVEAPPGNGPYVGWTIDPVITFRFAPGDVVNSLTIYVDDSNGAGGVSVPDGIRINGGPLMLLTDPATATPLSFLFDGLNLSGEIQLELIRKNQWLMLSEVEFDGVLHPTQVPEPGTLALLGTALTGLAIRLRRSRKPQV